MKFMLVEGASGLVEIYASGLEGASGLVEICASGGKSYSWHPYKHLYHTV